MKWLGKCGVILAIFSLINYGKVLSESIECGNIVCPQTVEPDCPPDSRPILFDPTTFINSDRKHHSSNSNILIDGNEDEIAPVFHSNSTDDTETTNSDDDETSSTKMLAKRSVQFKRRESIKITPGGYISKRSLPDDEKTLADQERLYEQCCPLKKCECTGECDIPTCDFDEQPIEFREDTVIEHKPGNCCSNFTCQATPNCNELNEGTTWLTPCHRCECMMNETFCHITCDKVEPSIQKSISTSCESENKLTVYQHGERWDEDECTNCQCLNGVSKCMKSVCKALSCPRTKYLPGECCPVCDLTETHFCPGSEHCDIACQFGHAKSNEGCSLCECASQPIIKDTTPIVIPPELETSASTSTASPEESTTAQITTTTQSVVEIKKVFNEIPAPPTSSSTYQPDIILDSFNRSDPKITPNVDSTHVHTECIPSISEYYKMPFFIAVIVIAALVLFIFRNCYRSKKRKSSYSSVNTDILDTNFNKLRS